MSSARLKHSDNYSLTLTNVFILELGNMVYLFLCNRCICLSCSDLACDFCLFLFSLILSSLVFAHQLWLLSFDIQSKFVPHWLPSDFVPLTIIYSLCCCIYVYSPIVYIHTYISFYNILSQPHAMRRRTCAVLLLYLYKPSIIWCISGAQNPSLSLLQRWEVSSLVVQGKQGSHTGLKLFFTGLFFFSSRQRML